MDIGFLHSHTLIVSLYLISLTLRFGLLATGRTEALKIFNGKTRVANIVLSVLMVVTGGYLLLKSPNAGQPFMLIKLGMVLASIPVGIIAFKREKAFMAFLAVALLGGAMALALTKPAFLRSGPSGTGATTVQGNGPQGGNEDPKAAAISAGKELFFSHSCTTCHGEDGAAGFQGAKNLKESTLSDSDMKSRIREGKGVMPADATLSDAEMDQLIQFIRSLKP